MQVPIPRNNTSPLFADLTLQLSFAGTLEDLALIINLILRISAVYSVLYYRTEYTADIRNIKGNRAIVLYAPSLRTRLSRKYFFIKIYIGLFVL